MHSRDHATAFKPADLFRPKDKKLGVARQRSDDWKRDLSLPSFGAYATYVARLSEPIVSYGEVNQDHHRYTAAASEDCGCIGHRVGSRGRKYRTGCSRTG